MTIPACYRFEATQALRQVLTRAVIWGLPATSQLAIRFLDTLNVTAVDVRGRSVDVQTDGRPERGFITGKSLRDGQVTGRCPCHAEKDWSSHMGFVLTL